MHGCSYAIVYKVIQLHSNIQLLPQLKLKIFNILLTGQLFLIIDLPPTITSIVLLDDPTKPPLVFGSMKKKLLISNLTKMQAQAEFVFIYQVF